MKKPHTPEYQRWIVEELENYIAATHYLAFFIEARSKMGDMSSEEVLEELHHNISLHMRQGYDVLGEH